MEKVLLVAAILCLASTAFAIQCYECDSSKNMACQYGLLSFTQNVKDCNANDQSIFGKLTSFVPTNCIKLVATDKGGNEYVARTCGINTGPVNICDAVAKVISFADGKDIAKMDCWQCDTDKCNSASGFSSMAVVGILAACFLFLF